MTDLDTNLDTSVEARGPAAVSHSLMLERLSEAADDDFARYEVPYHTFMTGAELEVQNSEFYGRLVDLHRELSEAFVLGNVRAIQSWSNGEGEFRVVAKSWESVIDKLFRINIEENELFSNPPIAPTIEDRAAKQKGHLQRWITPDIVHEVADDLLRTKFVVPFVDGVVDVGNRITKAIDDCGLRRFRRFHAKDSGYHARHYYIILPVPTPSGGDATVALEVKVLTTMQDTLGELTHLLYEKHRTGEISAEKKRKVAWQFGTSDFMATYLGHSGHFLEASVAELKDQILSLRSAPRG